MTIADRVNQVIDRSIRDNSITGTVVLISRHGKPLLRRAAGYADREAGRAVELDTIFRYASVTKPFVAITALAMIEARRFSLDTPVRQILPWFTPKLDNGADAVMTVRHLLTHTSGLTYDSGLEMLPEADAVTLGLSDTDLDLEANFSRLNRVPLAFAPGTQWTYSVATDILGAVVAKVDGGTLEEAVVRHVAGPLGLPDARFHVTDTARLAVAYADTAQGPIRMPDPWRAEMEDGWGALFSPGRIFNPKAFQSGGAGMAGTADAFLTLLESLRTGEGVLSPAMAERALSNQIGDIPGEPGVRFGFVGGIVTDPHLAETALPAGAVQWGGVYGHSWFIDRASGITCVALTNNALEGCMGQYPELIRRAVFSAGA